MEITPKGNRILIELIETPTVGAIVIPDNMEALDMSHFRVVAVGEGRFLHNGQQLPIGFEIGDEVNVHPNAVNSGQAVRLEPTYLFDDRKLMIVDAGAIMCVVKRDPEELMNKPKVRKKQPKPLKAENVPQLLH